MTSRRSPWALLIWPAALIVLVFVVWISGYLYWQIRISRAVADIKRDPSKYLKTPHYKNADLIRIGSRGLPRLLEELDLALAAGDVDQATGLYFGIGDLVEGAWGGYGQNADQSRLPLRERPSWTEMRQECREIINTWPQARGEFPPWWKWWSGSRRAP